MIIIKQIACTSIKKPDSIVDENLDATKFIENLNDINSNLNSKSTDKPDDSNDDDDDDDNKEKISKINQEQKYKYQQYKDLELLSD